ncbi:MAG: hypothetical protein R3E79_61165 [Caldilineaceae bacterium]
MSHALTIHLSDSLFQYFQEIAARTQQPLEQLVQKSLAGNLPPRLPTTSPALTAILLTMQKASVQELRQMADSQLSTQHQQRHFELLDKNAQDVLTLIEQQELAELRRKADELLVRKAYAWALLRWLGYPLPDLQNLPVD